MADIRKHSSTSNLIRFTLKHATTGVGLTGLTSASTGLIISTIVDNAATATAYTVAGSTIETITTLGTFATPTATKCRFKEVDATNHKGLYEFQFDDARFSVASAKRLVISVTGATNLLDADYEIQLVSFDPHDAVRMGMTALPNAAAESAGGLYTRGTGAGQIAQDANGNVRVNLDTIKTQAVTCAAGVTVPASIASPTNITAGTITTVTNLTNLPAAGALEATLTAMKGATYSEATDSLEAIRNRGDAAWVTGAGGSDRLLMVDTTIATLASQTSFTLTAGSADNNAYVNCTIVVEDAATATQKAVGLISAYTGATKTVTLKYDPAIFTMAATDKVYILAENSLKTTAQNRQLDVTATGAAGIDWANIENPLTVVDLAGTDINLVDTVTTYTGNTKQTGDVYVLANSIKADTAAILVDTAEIGAAGAGLTVLATQTSVNTIDDFLDTEIAAIKAKTDNLPASPAAVGDIPTAIQNADTLLDRNMATGTDSGSPTVRTPRQALRFLRNKWGAPSGTLTVTKEDDITTSWTAVLTTDAAGLPITGVDPA